jgi:hypothetical protein
MMEIALVLEYTDPQSGKTFYAYIEGETAPVDIYRKVTRIKLTRKMARKILWDKFVSRQGE